MRRTVPPVGVWPTYTRAMIPTLDALRTAYDEALPYDDFVALGEPHGHRPPWDQRHAQTGLSEAQIASVAGYTRTMHVLCLTGTWCGDCALQGAALQRVAEANPERVKLRFVMRDEDHAELVVASPINAGFRVPVTFLLSEDFELVHSFGDRTLSRYRSMARKDGRAAGHVLAEPPADPVLAVRDEVLGHIERAQLLLRLSARLREKHAD